ncbi:hypothetical protein WA158_001375 [Blastocystis sp. Blastoise]
MSEKVCVVCKKENSNYKCPICKSFFCSVNCSKIHKETCNKEQNKPDIVESDHKEEVDDEDDDIMEYIPEENLKRLDSPEFRKHIDSVYIMKLLKSIDESPDRVKDLERLRKNMEFSDIIDEMLITIGAGIRNENGDFEFTGL